MLKDITKKYPFDDEKSQSFKLFAFGFNENRTHLKELMKKMGYKNEYAFVERSLFMWKMLNLDDYINDPVVVIPKSHYGVITSIYKSNKFLYWTTLDITQALENPTFFTSIEKAFSKAYLDYLMFTLEGRDAVWYGPKPELFMKEDK